MENQIKDLSNKIEVLPLNESTKGYVILCPDRMSKSGRDNLVEYWYSKMPKDIPMVVLDGGMQIMELNFDVNNSQDPE